MKGALKRGGPTALNLYITSGAGFLGWAYFPKINVCTEVRRPGRHHRSLWLAPGWFHPGLQPRLHGRARGRTLARPLPHVRSGAVRLPGRQRPIDDTPPMLVPTQAVRSARTRARSPGSIRSTTTWTTPTTRATRSSRRVRPSSDAGPVLALETQARLRFGAREVGSPGLPRTQQSVGRELGERRRRIAATAIPVTPTNCRRLLRGAEEH